MATKKAKQSVKKSTKKSTKKYRITLICGNVGGSVTAENVGLSFSCPNCKTKIKVSDNFKKLEIGNEGSPGHQLRSVGETTNAQVGLT